MENKEDNLINMPSGVFSKEIEVIQSIINKFLSDKKLTLDEFINSEVSNFAFSFLEKQGYIKINQNIPTVHEENCKVSNQQKYMTINKNKELAALRKQEKLIEEIYEFMKKNIYFLNEKNDEEKNKNTPFELVAAIQEKKFINIDNELESFLGSNKDVLWKGTDNVSQKIKLLQEERYQSVYHEFYIEGVIKEWLRENEISFNYVTPDINKELNEKLKTEHIRVSLPIKVDMKKIRSNTNEVMNNHIIAVNGLAKEIIDRTQSSDGSNEYEFIYVVQRHDGMAIVVGKSHFKLTNGSPSVISGECGDLYKELNLGEVSGKVGTEKIIFGSLFGASLTLEYKNLLKNYYKTAWVIPIPNTLTPETFEKKLGEYLLCNDIPILNSTSH